MVKVINKETLLEERRKNKTTRRIDIFSGSREENLSAANPTFVGDPVEFVMPSGPWKNSAGYERLWGEIRDYQDRVKNAAQAPAAADLAALVSRIFIDITTRANEQPDLTSRIAQDITNLNFEENVSLRDIYKYRGQFMTISGANDSVPLIEQALGAVETVPLATKALGWKDSLKNMLYNSLHNMQKVNEAVSDADTDERNAAVIGAIVAYAYGAAQQQAAVDIANQTFDENMYDTIRQAVKALRLLLDVRTDRPIAVPSISILCNSADTWDIERVVRGQLNTGGGAGYGGSNRQALPVGEILEYDQGINNAFTWGKKTMSFPGVTAGTCYIFVPREYFWVLNKRNLTMETGRGSVLQLSTEEKAWYRANGKFDRIFFGKTTAGANRNLYGAIVEVTLPDEETS